MSAVMFRLSEHHHPDPRRALPIFTWLFHRFKVDEQTYHVEARTRIPQSKIERTCHSLSSAGEGCRVKQWKRDRSGSKLVFNTKKHRTQIKSRHESPSECSRKRAEGRAAAQCTGRQRQQSKSLRELPIVWPCPPSVGY